MKLRGPVYKLNNYTKVFVVKWNKSRIELACILN
jgi:hypothetical protein